MNTNDDETTTGPENQDAPGAETAVAESEEFKLSLNVRIDDVGSCKKHVSVTIPRSDVDHYYGEAVGELSESAQVSGFRTGHVPQKLIERRFRKELNDQVKQKLLMESLEQLSDEQNLDPINEPNIDVDDIEIPEEGDFEYEFDVEVRPDFELPSYEGLKIKRPVREMSESDVDRYLERYLSQYAELETHDGAAGKNNFVSVSVEFSHEGQPLHKLSDVTMQIKPILRFQDAELEGFDKLMCGVEAGQTRSSQLTVSREADSLEMRGESVQANFSVHSVRRLKMPEITKSLLNRIGVESKEQLRDEVREMLDRQAVFQQRQAVRREVLDKITDSADWDLPEDLVLKQVENALRREILEMQQAGFTTQEIQARENEMRQRAVTTTRQALKEHFVLDKIVTKEKIEVSQSDITQEITMMAIQRGDSPRRVRARLVKSGMIENLDAQIQERKAVDFILDRAEFEDVPAQQDEEDTVEAVSYSVCGLAVEAAATESDDNTGDE